MDLRNQFPLYDSCYVAVWTGELQTGSVDVHNCLLSISTVFSFIAKPLSERALSTRKSILPVGLWSFKKSGSIQQYLSKPSCLFNFYNQYCPYLGKEKQGIHNSDSETSEIVALKPEEQVAIE